jgi:hypothetical protein
MRMCGPHKFDGLRMEIAVAVCSDTTSNTSLQESMKSSILLLATERLWESFAKADRIISRTTPVSTSIFRSVTDFGFLSNFSDMACHF